MPKKIYYILLICCFCACSNNHKDTNQQTILYQTDSLQYAQHFSIARASNHTLLSIHNPWHQGQILGKYYLVQHDSIVTPNDGIKLLVPLQKICIQSAPHIGYIDALQQAGKVIGACSPQLFYNPTIVESYQKGHLAHLGDAYQMDLEKITQLAPQAIFTTAYPQADKQTERLQSMNLTVIATVEWAETNLLARAEWIKLWGALFNCSIEADRIFTATLQHYQALTQKAQTAQKQPSIMSGLPYKDTWYMPGGKSFMGQLFKDANLSYYYSNNEQTSSLPLSFETVWYHFNQADIWIGIDANTQQELLLMDERLHQFKAVKNNQLYHYRKRTTPQGGNDFWESAVVYPDKLLQDLLIVTHPEIMPNDTTYYIAPL